MNEDLRVIETSDDFHIFKAGERVTIIREWPGGKYQVENEKGQEDIVLEEHIRGYTPIDEYDDMYCDKCGGTACGC